MGLIWAFKPSPGKLPPPGTTENPLEEHRAEGLVPPSSIGGESTGVRGRQQTLSIWKKRKDISA